MRQLSGKLAISFTIWALFTALFHIYTAYFGSFEPRIQRAIHLLLLLPLVFVLFPAKKMKVNPSPSVIDWILAVVSMALSLYLILNSDKLNLRVEQVDELTGIQVILDTIVVGLVIEACRRAVSIVFAITVSFFFSYIFIAPFLPGMFYSRSYSFERGNRNHVFSWSSRSNNGEAQIAWEQPAFVGIFFSKISSILLGNTSIPVVVRLKGKDEEIARELLTPYATIYTTDVFDLACAQVVEKVGGISHGNYC